MKYVLVYLSLFPTLLTFSPQPSMIRSLPAKYSIPISTHMFSSSSNNLATDESQLTPTEGPTSSSIYPAATVSTSTVLSSTIIL